METLSFIISNIQRYVSSLDWSYILTFIILCYGINHYKVRDNLQKSTGTQMRTRYRVILVGLVYGAAVFFLRGYSLSHIENLFQSFIFALVFHKFIVEALVYWLAKHGLPESISRHILTEAQLKKLNDQKHEAN